MDEETYIAVSGGFDPAHIGHIRMIDDAACFGRVLVLLNSDEWLKRKKGYVFMPFEQRKEMLESIRNVHCVLPALDADNTVSSSICSLHGLIKYFGKGGDRTPQNTPEAGICEKYDIPIIYGLGGHFSVHSSKLIQDVQKG